MYNEKSSLQLVYLIGHGINLPRLRVNKGTIKASSTKAFET